MKQPPFNIFQEPEEIQLKTIKDISCSCGLDYFRARIVQGAVKKYLRLECPSCGEVIMEDLQR